MRTMIENQRVRRPGECHDWRGTGPFGAVERSTWARRPDGEGGIDRQADRSGEAFPERGGDPTPEGGAYAHRCHFRHDRIPEFALRAMLPLACRGRGSGPVATVSIIRSSFSDLDGKRCRPRTATAGGGRCGRLLWEGGMCRQRQCFPREAACRRMGSGVAA